METLHVTVNISCYSKTSCYKLAKLHMYATKPALGPAPRAPYMRASRVGPPKYYGNTICYSNNTCYIMLQLTLHVTATLHVTNLQGCIWMLLNRHWDPLRAPPICALRALGPRNITATIYVTAITYRVDLKKLEPIFLLESSNFDPNSVIFSSFSREP